MRRQRQQGGYIYRRGEWWVLRYRETVLEDGQPVRRQLAKQLAPVAPEHRKLRRPPESVEADAQKFLQPINSNAYPPEATQSLDDFVERVYFPGLEKQMRASTEKGYKARWETIKGLCGSYRLREFRTKDGQDVLNEVAKLNPKLLRSTLHHLKSLLSGIFTEAIRLGYLDGQVTLSGSTKTVVGNPMRGVRLPSAPDGEETYAYSLEEITRMLLYLPQPAYTLAAIAAFSGLRRSEIAGLLWENYDGQELRVTRSVWEGEVNEPKTKKSKAPVPVIPHLARILDAWREQKGNAKTGVMFPTSNKTPVSMNNVLNRAILPVLNRCQKCHKSKGECEGPRHEYRRDESLPAWHGWHAFRRGLATNLHRLGVPDKTIQAILRHSNVAVTQACYIKTVDSDSVAAMKLLEAALCANRALESVSSKQDMVN